MAGIESDQLGKTPDFRKLFESAPGLYLVLAPDLTIVAVSDAYTRATMTERKAILGRNIFDVFPDNPDDASATGVGNLTASLQRVLKTRTVDAMAVQKYDIRRPASEGGGFEERFWSPVNTPVLNDKGDLEYILHRAEDVTEFLRLKQEGTEQSRLAEELRTRNGKMETEIYKRAQEIQEANKQLRAAEEATRKANEQLEERVRERTKELSAANDALVIEMEHRRQLEEQFRQAQKMEAVGQLAGGVAHDFNNMLTVILSFTRFVREDLGPDHEACSDLLEVERSAERAATLTRQLLAFSRRQVLDVKVLDLNSVIANSEKMLKRLIGADIDLLTLPAKNLGKVKADAGHLEQVLLNLLVNARDAMPKGGKITIETAEIDLDKDYAGGVFGAKPGRYVMLAVSDTGVGMDARTQSQIFNPFFTTKEFGRAGLGLAMVHGMVKRCGGEIFVYSTIQKGTTFKIYLPKVEDSAEANRPKPRKALPPGQGTVLVVEDEDLVRAVAERVLRRAGYKVLVASDPTDALRAYSRDPSAFHLLLSDVVMPGMDGPTLAEKLKTTHQDFKVLFMSGYTGGALVHHGVMESGFGYLQKPFTPDVLLTRVREVLEG